jgi:hypothetical protein
VGELLGGHRLGVLERSTAGESRVFPPPEERLQSGDVLLVQGPLEALARARREFAIET